MEDQALARKAGERQRAALARVAGVQRQVGRGLGSRRARCQVGRGLGSRRAQFPRADRWGTTACQDHAGKCNAPEL